MGNTLTKAAITDAAIQLVCSGIAIKLQTEKFYDISGSATFIVLIIQSLLSNDQKIFPRKLIQSTLVCLWAMRLGLFLFLRIFQSGKDGRFDKVRKNPKLFFIFWAVQALWIFVTVCPTLILNSKQVDQELVSRDFAGWTVWGIGFLIEAIADYQKYIFRSNPANADKWITTGLWSVVRHPNYLGEIVMWFGLFISASTTFKGWEYLSLISPFFIAFLLTKVSGIPFLERRALKRWKDNPEFVTFLNNSYRLIPFLY